ncbi:MAG TPA: type VI secretion system tube protein TssD [Candidatus Sulfopaludibacter sp.]|jgi:type VI secretion system secreted protein Hcp|nr:type VI secretion system tube protein TssD [Candidatus Sulfopaludibacter sp.]
MASSGSVDIFVKIKGKKQGVIRGESVDKTHPNEIQALSYTWDITQPFDMSGSGLASGKRQFGQFKFLMTSQTATPLLLNAISGGEVLEVTVTCRKAGQDQQEYMVWLLKEAMIHKINTGYILAGEIVPHDEIVIVFRNITLTYRMQKSEGNLGGDIVYMDQWSSGIQS